MKKLSLVLIAVAAVSSSCTWVKVTDKGSSVALANAANVRGCTELRELKETVTAKVGFVRRNDEKVATELSTMARNDAGGYGGDTVVPTSGVTDGSQTFNVYKCSKK